MRTLLLLVVLAAACAREPTPPSPAPSGSPLHGLAAADDARWSGVVEERLAAGGYSYLAVRDAERVRWIAVMGPGEPPGSTVVVHALGLRTDFRSRRLDREFDELVFATVESAKPQPGSS